MSQYPPPPAVNPLGGQTPPPNNLVWAILTTLFCCLPFGIVSIVYAAKVNGQVMAGDLAGAQASSAAAKKWAIIAAVCGVLVGVIYAIAAVALIGAGVDSSTTY